MYQMSLMITCLVHCFLWWPIITFCDQVPVFDRMTCGTEQAELYCLTNADFISDVPKLSLESVNEMSKYDVVDLVFDGGDYNVTGNFFQQVINLFRSGDVDTPKEFRTKFQNFSSLHLHRRFFQPVCPSDGRSCELTLNVYNSRGTSFLVEPDAFQGLKADKLVIHNAHFSYMSFQTLFRNVDLNTLDLKGTYVNIDQSPFEGRIGKIILTKQASYLDVDEFPRFPSAKSYVINAQNIQSIDREGFDKYDNVDELSVKSKALIIKPGDLRNFRNLKTLKIEDATIDKGSFDGLTNLEELDLGRDVTINSVSDLKNLQHLKHVRMHRDVDVRLMCELATAVANDQTLNMDLPSKKCTCEHKFIARFRSDKNHLCYNYEADCTKTTCEVVNKYFGEQGAMTQDQMATAPGQGASDQSGYDDGVIATSSSNTIDRASVTMQQTDSPLENIKNIGETSSSKSSGRMNWIPIAIVTGILLLILVCAIVAYVIRLCADRRREFKPIPTHEDKS